MNGSPKGRTRPESAKLPEEDRAERASVLARTDPLAKTPWTGALVSLRIKAEAQGRLPEASIL